jgi:thiosulfate/3-mercaptopyruvate sulfurtransferase
MLASAALILVLAATPSAATPSAGVPPAVTPPAVTPPAVTPPIVSIDWLRAHLDDPSVVVIDAGGDAASFARGHIPRAGVLDHMATLRHGHRAADPAALARTFAAAGARDDAHIVLYGDDEMSVGWMFGLFASIGHADHVSLLDGNLAAWRAANHPVATGPAAVTVGHLTPKAPPAPVIVDGAWVSRRLEDPKFRLADVRSEDEWKRGMIPGAVKIRWQDFYANQGHGRFKTPAELRKVFERAGVTDQTVVTYCAVGMRASLAYFAARAAGLPALVYQGSMTDWTARDGPTKRH